jgi:3-oxoacyl-[acyl-carrier-protein] synthase-1
VSAPLDILSVGAVTPIGLDARQTAAAFRARIAGFQTAIPLPPPEEPLRAAKIPAHLSLRTSEQGWLVNLAARAIRECIRDRHLTARLGLIVCLPEPERNHPGLSGSDFEQIVPTIAEAVREQKFYLTIANADGGAGIATGLRLASHLIGSGEVDLCVVGGVDSLINDTDTARFRAAGRMLEPGNPKGLIPGEGAGFLLAGPADHFSEAVARLYGTGSAIEKYGVNGPRLSQGRGFEQALSEATKDGGVPESKVSFRVSTLNGEHYAVWESMFYTCRYYRTRRESFPVWYTASSVGDLGAAAGAVSVILAALGIAGGYAPGPFAMCESASDNGLRGGCLVGPVSGRPSPPFRPEEGSARLISRHLEPRSPETRYNNNPASSDTRTQNG